MATSLNIAPSTIANFLVVAATTTTAYSIAEYIRIRKVEMWSSDSSGPSTVSCDWQGSASTAGSYGKSVKDSDTSLGVAEPAHIVSKPPPDSQVAQWRSAADVSTLCVLNWTVANPVIDIVFDYIVTDAGAANAAVTVAAATVGANYCLPLDGAGGSRRPISYPTL